MSKRIVVNVGLLETRVAVQEGNLLTELYLERHRHRSIVGNVYKGTVTNVLPGMQAAFVDIGLAKDAFLYAGDYTANLGEASRDVLAEVAGEDDADADLDGEEEPKREATGPIEEMLSRAQQVLVNVGMVVGLIPVVGIPLPFMSYGGSSMVVSMMALGLLLSVRMRQFQ